MTVPNKARLLTVEFGDLKPFTDDAGFQQGFSSQALIIFQTFNSFNNSHYNVSGFKIGNLTSSIILDVLPFLVSISYHGHFYD